MQTNITFEHTNAKAGTHLQGHFKATYDELVKAFGEPTYRAEDAGGFDYRAEQAVGDVFEAAMEDSAYA